MYSCRDRKAADQSKKSQRRAAAISPSAVSNEKPYENYSTRDLEKAAQDNYEHPLGDFMRDPGIIANKEGYEEGVSSSLISQ